MDNDCFGLQPLVHTLATIPDKAFAFETSAEKIRKFTAWLEEQENLYILSEGREGLQIIIRPGLISGNKPWTNVFIDSAYSQGIKRAREELRRAGYDIASFEAFPRGIGGLMNQPFHAERVAAIYTRTFEDLKTVTQMMNGQTRRLIADGLTTGLARGMAEGKNPMTIARELVDDVANRVDKIGITRARLIARTEVMRAHHVANVAEYRQAEAEMQVTVEAEWLTAGYDVCPECEALEGKVFSLDEIEGMIPVHPNCRCVARPMVKSEEKV